MGDEFRARGVSPQADAPAKKITTVTDERPAGEEPEAPPVRRSRSSPSAGLVKSIDAFDELSSIAIRPSSNVPAFPKAGVSYGDRDSAVNATSEGRAPKSDAAAAGVPPPEWAEQPRAVGLEIAPSTNLSGPSSGAENAWPQWLATVMVFAGMVWYLLNFERDVHSPPQQHMSPPADEGKSN